MVASVREWKLPLLGQPEHINPRLVWCFRGEDMMQKMQTQAKSCVRRLNGAAATIKISNRYRLALHLEYTKNEKSDVDQCALLLLLVVDAWSVCHM